MVDKPIRVVLKGVVVLMVFPLMLAVIYTRKEISPSLDNYQVLIVITLEILVRYYEQAGQALSLLRRTLRLSQLRAS